MAGKWGDPGKNDFRLTSESSESQSEYTSVQSVKKARANDAGKKVPTLADAAMQIERQYK